MQIKFQTSKELTIGLEIELQIINPLTQNLASRAKDLIRSIQSSPYAEQIKPEMTQSMIEINSSIHTSPQKLFSEMVELCHFLKISTDHLNVVLCGGGTHPFQQWSSHKIFPSSRFRHLSRQYGYLAKRFTIFSMHVHVGCADGDQAIYLTHALSRFIPQLITLSAASPFYQGVYTGYHSTRVNVVNAFPLSGHLPQVRTWAEFETYYLKMLDLNIISSMKDFYWDIRPKAEYGTVEIRICDMPLTLHKAVALTAYIQSLVAYLLAEKPFDIADNFYDVYDFNRFQASRFGYNGDFINPFTLKHSTIQKDILTTLKIIEPHAKKLGNDEYIQELKSMADNQLNDANYLKEVYENEKSLQNTVLNKCQIWKTGLEPKLN